MAAFGDCDGIFEAAKLAPEVRRVRRGKIRVYADELTYPLHIALRFDIERRLISGAMKVADVPSAWRQGMSDLLDVELRPHEHGAGCMQDIHWAMGAFGYFPTYALGAAYASQFMHAIREEVGGKSAVDELIRKGEHMRIVNWLRAQVWNRGSELPTATAMLLNSTGEPLNPKYYREHLYDAYLKGVKS